MNEETQQFVNQVTVVYSNLNAGTKNTSNALGGLSAGETLELQEEGVTLEVCSLSTTSNNDSAVDIADIAIYPTNSTTSMCEDDKSEDEGNSDFEDAMMTTTASSSSSHSPSYSRVARSSDNECNDVDNQFFFRNGVAIGRLSTRHILEIVFHGRYLPQNISRIR